LIGSPRRYTYLDGLISAFGKKQLSPTDLTVLSGAHTIGFS
jgi:hypothetical protein